MTGRLDMKSEAMDNFSALFHRLDVGQTGTISCRSSPEFAAGMKKPEADSVEELVPVEELERDDYMVAAAVKNQAVHRGRASRKGAA